MAFYRRFKRWPPQTKLGDNGSKCRGKALISQNSAICHNGLLKKDLRLSPSTFGIRNYRALKLHAVILAA